MEAAASGSSDLVIRKDKADQFFECQVKSQPEILKRLMRIAFLPVLRGRRLLSFAHNWRFFYARELKGTKLYDLWEKDLKTIQRRRCHQFANYVGLHVLSKITYKFVKEILADSELLAGKTYVELKNTFGPLYLNRSQKFTLIPGDKKCLKQSLFCAAPT